MKHLSWYILTGNTKLDCSVQHNGNLNFQTGLNLLSHLPVLRFQKHTGTISRSLWNLTIAGTFSIATRGGAVHESVDGSVNNTGRAVTSYSSSGINQQLFVHVLWPPFRSAIVKKWKRRKTQAESIIKQFHMPNSLLDQWTVVGFNQGWKTNLVPY